jgi:hypothetical protein
MGLLVRSNLLSSKAGTMNSELTFYRYHRSAMFPTVFALMMLMLYSGWASALGHLERQRELCQRGI